MSDDRPTVAELRAHARAIDEGLEEYQRSCRVWLVSGPRTMFSGEPLVHPKLVLARNAPEARHLFRTHLHDRKHEVPRTIVATEIDVTEPRILDGLGEETHEELRRVREDEEREAERARWTEIRAKRAEARDG